MPNALVKKVAKKTGNSVAEVEKLWKKLTKEYGETNYKAIVGSLKKSLHYTAEDSNREKNEFNHLKVKECVLTAESVDEYLGSELPANLNVDKDKSYSVYRPANELKKALSTYNDVPLTNEHFFVDSNVTNKDKWIGSVGSEAKFKDGKVYNKVTIWDKAGVDLVERIRKDGLSCGYKYKILDKKGVFNGKPYDFMMKDITCNHVALVDNARVKYARLADENLILKGIEMKAEQILVDLLTKNPHLIADNKVEENVEKKEKIVKDKKHKKAKDKIKEKEEKHEEDEVRNEVKAHDSFDINKQINSSIIAYNKAKELCERVIGKTTFAVDSTPEQMLDATLKAKNVDYGNIGIEAKTVLLQYIADSKSVKKEVHIIATDSKNNDNFKLINI